MNTKKANDLSTLKEEQKKKKNQSTEKESLELEGVGNSKKYEQVPQLLSAPSETKYSGFNNADIVFGRDRPSILTSGYGGRGDSHCGRIDIVVGRNPDPDDPLKTVHPNFKRDAARIYISQRTDIDKNFNIVKGNVGNLSERSAIGIKADAVRIIGRQGIKLVTKTEKVNSAGGPITAIKGIDLIAGNNDSDLQPLAKEKNLLEVLQFMQEDILKIVGMINSLATKQVALDGALSAHTHSVIPDPTSPTLLGTLPSLALVTACAIDASQIMFLDYPSHFMTTTSAQAYGLDYLNKGGSNFILSKFNTTN